MKVWKPGDWKDCPLFALLCLGALLLPVTNAVGQVPLYLASVWWLVLVCRGRCKAVRSTWGLAGLWMLLVTASLAWAVHPELGQSKLNRLLIYPLMGAVAASAWIKGEARDSYRTLAGYYVAGVMILGIHDLVQVPWKLHQGLPPEDIGEMAPPQFYMVGLMLSIGLMRRNLSRKRWVLNGVCLLVCVAGIIVHQKRGVWLATLLALGLWALWRRRWKWLLAMALVAALAYTLPFVQNRLDSLREVIQPTHGGRMVLWREVAPRLFAEYPRGMGYNGSKYEDFAAVLPRRVHLEPGLRHLHNNLLQIRLELGWPGILLWTGWMILMVWRALRGSFRGENGLQLAVAFALIGLLLNGMVEYNFGNSAVMKVYLLLFGMIDGFALRNSSSISLALYTVPPYKHP